jgi:hypothetical protein
MTNSFNLEAEVRDLAARRDIYEAVCNYIRGQDRLLPEVQREAFHPDARVDCGIFSGTGYEWVDWAQKVLGEMGGSQHLLGQVQINVSGDTADGEVYFIAWHRIVEDGVEKDWIFGGRYIDRYESRHGKWKIARRRELVDWIHTANTSDQWLRDNPEFFRGARGLVDFSCRRDWSQQRR